MQRLLTYVLIFTFSVSSMVPWASSDSDTDCETSMQLFQVPCIVLCNGYNWTDVSGTAIPKFVKLCHSGVQDSKPILFSEFITESEPDTCRCNRDARKRQTSSFEGMLPDSPHRPVRLLALNQHFIPYFNDLWNYSNKTESFLPSDHLKSLSCIFLII